jgi:hypothetical protein
VHAVQNGPGTTAGNSIFNGTGTDSDKADTTIFVAVVVVQYETDFLLKLAAPAKPAYAAETLPAACPR